MFFANRARGIFKPKQMSGALSVKTVVPREGRRAWYEDQHGEDRFDAVTGFLRYDLARGGPEDPTNRALQLAMERRAPVIYFVGLRPGMYEPLFPVWVEAIHGSVALLSAAARPLPDFGALPALERERSYTEQTVRVRRHQQWFSARTKAAYGHRCGLSGLPVPELLVAAHIKPDAEAGSPRCATESACPACTTTASIPTSSGWTPTTGSTSPGRCATAPTAPCSPRSRATAEAAAPAGAPAGPAGPALLEERFAEFEAAHRS